MKTNMIRSDGRAGSTSQPRSHGSDTCTHASAGGRLATAAPTLFTLGLLLLAPALYGAATPAVATPALAAPAPISAQDLAFFESKVRPILVENCYKCHSRQADKVKGGLLLDTREGLLHGGNSGEVIVPGKPDDSLLVVAIRYTDPELQMPDDKRLTDQQIADLTEWVRRGAPDPRDNAAKGSSPAYGGVGRQHWSFQPLKKPEVPAVKNATWVQSPVDNFILEKLEAAGIAPNPAADKRTLLRRVTFDLIGLPPSEAEVQAFLADKSPAAFAKVVDRLLASPQYGERWGRYWLDVARYADTKGDPPNRNDARYPYAWTYRDYVINAFNTDKPYNQFIMEQLAADLLISPPKPPAPAGRPGQAAAGRAGARANAPGNAARANVPPPNAPARGGRANEPTLVIPDGADRSSLAALGFLTLGNQFDGNMNDQINDQIDVTTKGFLGMTVSCARCHDHKFDPIPTKDYYSLYGIFASSVQPATIQGEPLLAPAPDTPEHTEYVAKLAEMNERLVELNQQQVALRQTAPRGGAVVPGQPGAARAGAQPAAPAAPVEPRGVAGLTPQVARPAAQAAQAAQAVAMNSSMGVSAAPDANNAMGGGMADNAMGNTMGGSMENSMMGTNSAPGATPVAPGRAGAAPGRGTAVVSDAQKRQQLQREQQQLQSDFTDLELSHPGAYPRANVLLDKPNPANAPVLLRGEAQNKGEVVPRHFLDILSGPNRPNYILGSGRLELARDIASPTNPLTARVLVNRIWQHHFGEGFVPTPDDLGNMSAPPSHPELLDYLAVRFMAEGWSIKQLHRTILLTSVYQESGLTNPRYADVDPDNKLHWRYNMRRLDFEAVHDSILAIAGTLDLKMGGRSVPISSGEFATRRAVYTFIDRANPAEILTQFDVPNPSVVSGKRYETIVPQQALFLMNSPLVIETSRKLTHSAEFLAHKTDQDRVRTLYLAIFQRPPTDEETKLSLTFVRNTPGGTSSAGPALTPQQQQTVARAGRAAQQQATAAGRAARGAATGKGNFQAEPGIEAFTSRDPLDVWTKLAHALFQTNEAVFYN
ncbi:MAG: hypothetical protein RL324_883 [Verrucomicrobiota bacterium]|jgi:hypothetical protein